MSNHTGCERHRRYQLTCADYDHLLTRSVGRCEACGLTPRGGRPLVIDHDHTIGDHAVRGLICTSCNYHLDQRDATLRKLSEAQLAYLASPFWQEVPHPGVYEVLYSPKGAPGHLVSIPEDLWVRIQGKRGRGSAAAAVRRAIEEYVK